MDCHQGEVEHRPLLECSLDLCLHCAFRETDYQYSLEYHYTVSCFFNFPYSYLQSHFSDVYIRLGNEQQRNGYLDVSRNGICWNIGNYYFHYLYGYSTDQNVKLYLFAQIGKPDKRITALFRLRSRSVLAISFLLTVIMYLIAYPYPFISQETAPYNGKEESSSFLDVVIFSRNLQNGL